MAGGLIIDTLNAGSGPLATQNGMTGIAKAWVVFDGTPSTPTIRGSFNISSITKGGTGSYTAVFTTALPDANFSVVTSTCQGLVPSSNYMVACFTQGTSTTGISLLCRPDATSDTKIDLSTINVSVFR